MINERDFESKPAPSLEWINRSWNVPYFERLQERVNAFKPGDRFIFYVLALVLCVASVYALYALQQSLLIQIPTYGGSLVEGRVGSPRFINPLLALSDSDKDLVALTYAGLMGLDGNGKLIPVIAEDYTISQDGKVYTFRMKQDVKFTDGSLVTAFDVVFTVQKVKDPTLRSPEYSNWAGVSVEAVDSHTVQFTLPKPYAPFLGLTTLGILPARLWQNLSNEEFLFSIPETHSIGAGPFKIERITRDASGLISSVFLTTNSNYVLGRPYLDSIRFNFYSRAEDLVKALENGDIESAHGIPFGRIMTAPYSRVFGVFFNANENPALIHLDVRKALSLAVNRDELISDVLYGHATAIIGPLPPRENVTLIPLQEYAFDDTTRIANAAQVLRKSGWTYNGTERMWENSRMKQSLKSITIRTSNVPEMKNVASAIKNDWERIGITTNIELYKPGDLSENVIRPREYEALLFGMVIGRDQDLYAFWSSRERNDPGLNIALYANITVDALLESVRSSVNPSARRTSLQKIENIIASEYPAVFLYAPNFVYSVPDDLRGIELPQIVIPSDRFATVTQWYRVTDSVWPFLAPR